MSKSFFQNNLRRIDILLFLLLSYGLLIVGILTPTVKVEELGLFTDTFSIWLGISILFEEAHYFLGLLILIFSIIFPFAKLIALSYVWFKPLSDSDAKDILHFLKLLGKWSMLDVFVVAITIVVAKLSNFANATAQYGIYIFASAIFASMITMTLVQRVVNRKK